MARRRRRTRLSAEEARARILEAASERLRAVGPQGLKLTTLAKELGVSHQAILHHFGSRDGLVHAVMKEALDALQKELAAGLMVLDDEHERGGQRLIEHAFRVMADERYGRLLGYLALENPEGSELDRRRPLQMLAQMAHVVRERNAGAPRELRDTQFVLVLLAYAVLGASVFERPVLLASGLGEDPDAPDDFREWLAELVVDHLQTSD